MTRRLVNGRLPVLARVPDIAPGVASRSAYHPWTPLVFMLRYCIAPQALLALIQGNESYGSIEVATAIVFGAQSCPACILVAAAAAAASHVSSAVPRGRKVPQVGVVVARVCARRILVWRKACE